MDFISKFFPFIFMLIALLIVIEIIIYRKDYTFDETVSNILNGLSYISFEAYFRIFALFAYSYCLKYFSIQTLAPTFWTFVFSLLLYDLIIYWNHRLAHRSNMFWGAHIGHHQSEHLNTGAAVRVTIGNRLFYFPPVLLMAIIGVPIPVFLLANTLVGLYPILTHTPLTKRIRGFEWIFVTPSHHRVHHGTNPEYIDKNYGSLFSFWDSLFGTYEPERANVNFGITKKMPRYSIWGGQFLYFWIIYKAVQEKRSILEKWNAVFGPPENFTISETSLNTIFERASRVKKSHTHSHYQIAFLSLLSVVSTLFWIMPGHSPKFNHGIDPFEASAFLAFIFAWIASNWIQENQNV